MFDNLRISPPRLATTGTDAGSRQVFLVLVAMCVVQVAVVAYLVWLFSLAIRDGATRPGHYYRAPYYHIMCVIDWAGAVAGLVALALAFLARPQRWVGSLVDWCERHVSVCALAIAVVCGVLSLTVHHAYPLTMDEYAPSLQARVFARGRLVGQWPKNLAPFLLSPEHWMQPGFLHLSQQTGQVCSDYAPGHAILLAGFEWAGVPWACNPTLSGIAVFLMASLSRRCFGPGAAGWAILFTAASPVFAAYGMSFYSMMSHCTANLLYASLLSSPTLARAFAAGGVGGFALALHNPFPHTLFGLPWLAWLAGSRRRWPTLVMALVGYAAIFVPLDVGWQAVERAVQSDVVIGSAADPPPVATARGTVATGRETAGEFVARLASYRHVLRLDDLQEVVLLRWSGFVKLVAWDSPGLLVLACLGCWLGRGATPVRLLTASAVTTFFGYSLVTMSGGHGWGYRYFFSAWGCLPVLAGGAAALWSRNTDGGSRPQQADFMVRVGLAAVASVVVILPLRCAQIEGFIRTHLAQRPPITEVGDRGDDDGFLVAFIDPRLGYFRSDLIRNDPFLESGPYILASQDPETDARVVATMAESLHATHRRVHADVRGTTWEVVPR